MTRPAILAALAATPAFAADEYGFVSIRNTDFIVLIAFLVFIGILVYFDVPRTIMGLLDKRAQGIRDELDEARRLREEAQTVLASYERKGREAQKQADRIVATAKEEARAAAEKMKADMRASIDRRVRTAQDQIDSARAEAVRDVRDRAIEIANAAAAEVVQAQMGDDRQRAMADESIAVVDQKLH